MQLELPDINSRVPLDGDNLSRDNRYHVMHYQGKKITFTKREIESLHLLKAGYTTNEIAIQLNRSPRTIESRLINIKDKFGIKRKSDLIRSLHECL